MIGAKMDPTLAMTEHIPIPVDLRTVGKSSAAYT